MRPGKRGQTLTLLVDEAVGETRRLLLTERQERVSIALDRWSRRGARARVDQIRRGRIVGKIGGQKGWFVDLGIGSPGLLSTTGEHAPSEGELVRVKVRAEAAGDKGPILSFLSPADAGDIRLGVGLISEPEKDRFVGYDDVIRDARSDLSAREEIDAAIEEALSPRVPLPGGGAIWIEPTRALVAVDVDAGEAKTSTGRPERGDRFANAINVEAASQIARQLRLRALSGLVVVDFLKLKSPTVQKTLVERFRAELETYHPGPGVSVSPISRAGLCEAILPRRFRPLQEAYLDADPGEIEALALLRALETACRHAPTRRFEVSAGAVIWQWLEADAIGWRKSLADRVGYRWRTAHDPALPPAGFRLRETP